MEYRWSGRTLQRGSYDSQQVRIEERPVLEETAVDSACKHQAAEFRGAIDRRPRQRPTWTSRPKPNTASKQHGLPVTHHTLAEGRSQIGASSSSEDVFDASSDAACNLRQSICGARWKMCLPVVDRPVVDWQIGKARCRFQQIEVALLLPMQNSPTEISAVDSFLAKVFVFALSCASREMMTVRIVDRPKLGPSCPSVSLSHQGDRIPTHLLC